MKATCKKMDLIIETNINGKIHKNQMYAFINEDGHTIIQTCNKSFKKYLEEKIFN